MSTKHTPGPWFTDGGQGVCSHNKRSPLVAQVNGVHLDPGHAEMLANVALISAAPELLAACEALLDHMSEADMAAHEDQVAGMLNAIAKAKGEKA